MDVNDIANNATGKRKIAVEAMKERVAKIKKAQICPILTDTELEALIVVSTDSDVLWKRCSAKSSEASTLGRYTNMSVMKDCEKQAQRVLFFWDNHSYERAKKRYSD